MIDNVFTRNILLVLSCFVASLAAPFSSSAQQFGTPAYYRIGPADAHLTGAVTADFNKDGAPDLATLDAKSFHVNVLLNTGNGTFGKPISAFKFTEAPHALATGDFNGDGIPDLAVVTGSTPAHVQILLGKGDGTFTFKASYIVGISTSVVVADFNGDGKLDVAVTGNPKTRGGAIVMFGNGDGTLQAPAWYPATLAPETIVAADVNGDGFPDLIVGGNVTGHGPLAILLNHGDGTFEPPVHYAITGNPVGIAVGDLNNDGKPDLVVTSTGTIAVMLGNGDGTFGKPVHYSLAAVGSPALAVAIADFNLDGNLDVIVGTGQGTLALFYGKGTGNLKKPVAIPVLRKGASALVVADFNNDKAPDVGFTTVDKLAMGVLLNAQ